MEPFALLLLLASVVCSTARAVFSKKLGALSANTRGFYLTQALLFLSAAIAIFFLSIRGMCLPSRLSLLLALAYGICTVLAQWMYTIALGRTQVSVCAMVYSFGFIIPTIAGTLAWHEGINLYKAVSILLCLCTIVLTSFNRKGYSNGARGSILPLIVSMIASGGLGIVQKLQQTSSAASETGVFLFMAFILAAVLSLLAAFFARTKADKPNPRTPNPALYIGITGCSMAIANTANTLLVGRLPSAVAFPIVNVGVILASLAVSALFLKERITGRQILAIGTGLTAILLFQL